MREVPSPRVNSDNLGVIGPAFSILRHFPRQFALRSLAPSYLFAANAHTSFCRCLDIYTYLDGSSYAPPILALDRAAIAFDVLVIHVS